VVWGMVTVMAVVCPSPAVQVGLAEHEVMVLTLIGNTTYNVQRT
jgi:hypothetical protein